LTADQPVSSYGNYPHTRAVLFGHIACMHNSTITYFDFLAFCGLEENAGVTMNVLDEDGAG